MEDTAPSSNKVETVDEYKYLGTTIDNGLRCDRRCSVIYQKCQQRLNSLRKHRCFNIDKIALFCQYFIRLISAVYSLFVYLLVWECQSERIE